ncbi:MAG: hypothetical protein J0M08_13710 [Bacteroidetes bacterium]|nr:hypothetical protein [Bacteroidota bacterium]
MKKIAIVLIVISVVLLGYLRDFIFVNTNYSIYLALHPDSYNLYAKGVHSFFLTIYKDVSIKTMYLVKYFFTVLFIILYFLLVLLSCRYIFSSKQFDKFIIVLFSIFSCAGIAVYLFIYELFNKEWGYTLSRYILGIIQTPIIVIIIFGALLAFTNLKKHTNE